MTHRKGSQISRIKAHLESGYSITALQALPLYGTFRLADIIFKLREKDGMNVQTWIKVAPNGSQYAEYYVPDFGL